MNFIINRWVRGDDFFGRTDLLADIEQRRRKPTWVLGNRRVGKTSLLRQIQYLCKEGRWGNRAALYWDLQGAGSGDGLKESFLECLEDHEALTEELGLDIDELEDLPFKDLLNKFRRKVKGLKDKHLLLLIDECEELVDITAEEPGILAPFRKLTQGDFPFSIIMAGSWRMMDLDESDVITSPFLPDFLPPLLLGPFSSEESLALLTARGLPEEVARAVHRLCLGNPHLLQMIGEHAVRAGGNLELALAELQHNKVAHYFFNSNFNCLPPGPREWLGEGLACVRLALAHPNDVLFPYLAQSALVAWEQDQARVSPLLHMVETELDPPAVLALLTGAPPPPSPLPDPEPPLAAPAAAPQTPSDPPDQTPANADNHPLAPLRRAVAVLARKRPLPRVLPATGLSDDAASAGAAPPDPVTFFSDAVPREARLELLRRASPEYLCGTPADGRTLVYLAGLAAYTELTGGPPFPELSDPEALLAAVVEQDVPIDAAFRRRCGLTDTHAMILMRCLRAAPGRRYRDLDHLGADLDAL